jgi:SAM-dependent methyltransferase
MKSDFAAYWNRVANQKTFTHPLDLSLLEQYVSKDACILDYGCGYGRLVKALKDAGYQNITGIDFSEELIKRGKHEGAEQLFYIDSCKKIPLEDHTVDCILLFAVLTCIPDNALQTLLIDTLFSKLKRGGILYMSDYYLQEDSVEVDGYSCLNGDRRNYGVFSLPDGGIFRHHTPEWIAYLLKDFTIEYQTKIDVNTMNGNRAQAFQQILLKPLFI